MEIEDLLDTHSLLQLLVNELDETTDTYNVMVNTYDIDIIDTPDNVSVIIIPFKFNSYLTTDYERGLVFARIHFTGDYIYKPLETEYDCDMLDFVILSDTTQPDGKVRVNFKLAFGSGYVEQTNAYENDVDLDIGVTYACVLQWENKGDGTFRFSPGLYSIDETGEFTVLPGDHFDLENTTAYFEKDDESEDLLFHKYELIVSIFSDHAYSMLIYEMDAYYSDDIAPVTYLTYKAFRPFFRRMAYTVYNDTYWKNYLVPPQSVIDGSLYDVTLILDTKIADFETYVETLEITLDSNEAKLEVLQNDLDNANEIIDELIDEYVYTPGTGIIRTYWEENLMPEGFNYNKNLATKTIGYILDILDSLFDKTGEGSVSFTRLKSLFDHFRITTQLFELEEDSC